MSSFSIPTLFCIVYISFVTFVISSPSPKYRPDAVVNGIGLPISNTEVNQEIVVPNQYIVVYSKNATTEQVESHTNSVKSILKKRALKKRNEDGTPAEPMLHSLALPGWNALCLQADDATILDIESASEVAYVEADTYMKISEIKKQENAPPGLARLSHEKETDEDEYVFDVAKDGEGVTVYIVDTGIRTTHVEFGGRATMGANFINKVNTDENGHGSHVAATVGGASFGVAKQATIIGVKVLDASGSGSNAVVLRGLNFVNEDAKKKNLAGKAVVNISIGGGKSEALNAAIESLTAAGVTVVVAAGNENQDCINTSPASATSAITVGAIDPLNDKRASFSNFGKSVDINAPGVAILSAGIANDTDTKVLSGTSMASPHVAGLAAYLISTENISTPEAVIARMIELAKSTGASVKTGKSGTTSLIAYNGSGE